MTSNGKPPIWRRVVFDSRYDLESLHNLYQVTSKIVTSGSGYRRMSISASLWAQDIMEEDGFWESFPEVPGRYALDLAIVPQYELVNAQSVAPFSKIKEGALRIGQLVPAWVVPLVRASYTSQTCIERVRVLMEPVAVDTYLKWIFSLDREDPRYFHLHYADVQSAVHHERYFRNENKWLVVLRSEYLGR